MTEPDLTNIEPKPNGEKRSHSVEDGKKSETTDKATEQLDVYIGAVKTDQTAAQQFHELVTKTLKIQP